MKPLIIVSGLGRTGYKIYQLLKQQGAEVVGLSDRTLVVQEDDRIIVGDLCSPQVLIEAGIKEATTIVLASNDDALNIAILTQAKTLNPKIRIVNRLYNQTLGQRLDYTVTDHLTMSVARLAAPIFAFSALGSKTIGHLRLFEQTWSLHEEIIDSNHPWYGVSLSHLWENLEQMLIYYLPKIGEMDLVTGVKTEQKLQLGDHLIVAHKTKFKRKSRFLWKQWFKFFFNLSTYKQYVRPVIMVTLILIILIALASIIY